MSAGMAGGPGTAGEAGVTGATGTTGTEEGGAGVVETGPGVPAQPSPVGARPAEAERALIRSAAEHLRRYQTLMGQGRAAEAGAELDALARDLKALSGKP